ETVCRFCRASRKRNVEHPDLGSGHGAGNPPDHRARARQYVSTTPFAIHAIVPMLRHRRYWRAAVPSVERYAAGLDRLSPFFDLALQELLKIFRRPLVGRDQIGAHL